jgi:hypothetical protein
MLLKFENMYFNSDIIPEVYFDFDDDTYDDNIFKINSGIDILMNYNNDVYFKNNGYYHIGLLINNNEPHENIVHSYSNSLSLNKLNNDPYITTQCFLNYPFNNNDINNNNNAIYQNLIKYQKSINEQLKKSNSYKLSEIINVINKYDKHNYSIIVNACLSGQENVDELNESMNIIVNNFVKPINKKTTIFDKTKYY